MQRKYISHTSAHPPSLLRKTAAIVGTVAVAGLVLAFSAVLLAAVLVVGVFAAAFLWWKTRELRKQMRNFPPRGADMESDAFNGEVFKGEIIEGEATRVDEPREDIKH